MIVLLEPFGDHSNRLLQDLQLRIWCAEYGIAYCNPSMADIGNDLVGSLREVPFIGLMTRIRRLGQRLGWKTKHRFGEGFPLPNPAAFRRGIHFVESWDFHQSDLMDAWGDQFRKFYCYRPDKLDGSELLLQAEEWKRQGIIVVGVHIRRGDYRHWQNGLYYFEDLVYQRIMDHMTSLHPLGTPVHYVVCTNDPTCSLSGMNTYLTNGTWQQDHTILSRCDYIIGPPSTFSLWASFLGRAKYWHIPNADAVPELSDFRVFQS